MNKEMYTESVLVDKVVLSTTCECEAGEKKTTAKPEAQKDGGSRPSSFSPSLTSFGKSSLLRNQRMLKYKAFATAFSYPDDSFYEFFPELSSEKEKLMFEYDRLFRANEVWLYGTEHIAQNEFQRANYLSDIMGFYRAFGLEPDKDRPDSLSCELEFMHYLIFKGLHALKDGDTADSKENASICLDAQKKFFTEHLYPAARKIGEVIIAQANNDFYIEMANEMLEFLESEHQFFGGI